MVVVTVSKNRFPIEERWVEGVVVNRLRNLGVRRAAQVSVEFVGSLAMRRLNRHYRGLDKAVAVLSFPTEALKKSSRPKFVNPPSEPLPLGDVVVAYPQVVLRAREQGKTVKEELEALLRHGVKNLVA